MDLLPAVCAVFFFQAEDGIRDLIVTGVQTCALPISNKRMSTFSTSRASNPSGSRPQSHVFPLFFSSLPYTQVRDFAYPVGDPAHYGAPTASGVSTPASESRRQSDPAILSWNEHKWSKMPPWFSESSQPSSAREHLPAMAFSDGGPPYSEDEDLHSLVVTTARHKQHKSASSVERGRSQADMGRGLFLGSNGDGSETYYVKGTDRSEEHTSELQSRSDLVCRLLLEKK